MYGQHTSFTKFGVNFYANESEINEHIEDVKRIIDTVNEELKDYELFSNIDFCDVSAGGIQVRTFVKDVPGCAYQEQFTILHDWSNVDEVITGVIAQGKKITEKAIDGLKDMLADFAKYGCD